MSIQNINNYYNKISQYKRFVGTRNETSLRRAFANLLEEYCLPKNLQLVDEVFVKTGYDLSQHKRPDGTVKNASQQSWGHWESKDVKDNLDEEIEKKIQIGYPTFNILFENSEQIVLIQQGEEVMRGEMKNPDFLHRVLTTFVEYERPEITDFRVAVEKFKEDIPDIVEALRAMIANQEKNPDFRIQREKFWNVCRESINPEISAFDIREMLIQHILTAEIFDTVFGDSHFHRENNIARELEIVVNTFFTGAVRRDTLASIDSYYKVIKREAGNIESYHEKQKFLKVVYENFYKAYNPKGADKLGVVYTPNEIVKFMVESADYLLEKHFGKSLADKNVQILDPATGTGTFITDIIEYIPEQYLKDKYKNDIHCNELAILPYYIANLNIEYIYQQKMKKYEPFENIVFVDTLDNLGFDYIGKQNKLFAVSTENLDRIKRQNEKKISVIIGNPPYNANQQNENDNNKNRAYTELDKRIKDTYIKHSKAQKSKVYDMYARFYRWATDRINGNGIVAFITNRSFIDSRTFDGFRKSMSKEFDYAYIVDLNGDIRANSGQAKANVFNIMTGVAIAFFIRKEKADSKFIKYYSLDYPTAKEKLEFLNANPLRTLPFDNVIADENSNWINIADNNFNSLNLLIDKQNKLAKSIKNKNVLFFKYSNGTVTNRDEWVFDYNKELLKNKIIYFFKEYNSVVRDWEHNIKGFNLSEKNHEELMKKASDFVFSKEFTIKWSGRLFRDKLLKLRTSKFKPEFIRIAHYRPFTKKYLYSDYIPIDIQGQLFDFFPNNKQNKIISLNQSKKDFNILAADTLIDLHFNGDSVCIPLYRYDNKGHRSDNLTDWGLKQFSEFYKDDNINKEAVFYYTYAVLHNPAYSKKYELNIKREFPRIPFYNDFWKWSNWGKELMDLHIGYEKVNYYPNVETRHALSQREKPKPKLKALPESGEIILDENTSISGIPDLAWEYKFGNRSALHWILDQYKEKKQQDKTIAEKFNNYRFADFKDTVIDLIKRITTVSVKTMEIVNIMETEEQHNN
jgi:predicted helicase